jgi:RHS repeat-associated protein
MKQLSFSFKTLMLVLSLLCANKQLYAQYDYIPLVEEGKVWNYGEDADLTSPTLYSYFIMGDTVIGGQEYKKMFKQTHDDGFIGFNGTTPSYFCYLKDHQGNIRSVLNSSGAVQEYNRYYPYGTTHGSQMYGNIQPYKYNGKELDRMHGLDLYDYGARYYDAAMARWTSMDPLCEQYYSISPYAYCADNPVSAIDKEGKKIFILNSTESAITNLSKIYATNEGRDKIDQLINSNVNYCFESVFWTSNSAYDTAGERGRSHTVYYPTTVLKFWTEGGIMNSLYAMGHELKHAYDDDTYGIYRMEKRTRESSAVFFENYLRTVYGHSGWLRTGYWGLSLDMPDKELYYNSNQERVRNFSEIYNNHESNSPVIGYSFEKRNNGEWEKKYIIGRTVKKQFYIEEFQNEKEYNNSLLNLK